jgi:hypothetical protein
LTSIGIEVRYTKSKFRLPFPLLGTILYLTWLLLSGAALVGRWIIGAIVIGLLTWAYLLQSFFRCNQLERVLHVDDLLPLEQISKAMWQFDAKA